MVVGGVMKKKYKTFALYLLLFIYLELVNRILMFNELPRFQFLYVILFSICAALFFNVVTKLLSTKNNKRICTIIVIVTIGLYLYNFLYFSLFSVPFSISNLEVATKALGFYKIGLHLIKTDFMNIVLFLLPFFIFLIYRNDFDYEKQNAKKGVLTGIAIIILHVLTILSLNINKKDLYSPYNLYYNVDSLVTSTKELGVLTSARLNMKRYLLGFQEKIIEEAPEEEVEENKNKRDIDFDTLIKNEKDENTKQALEYLKNKKATNKNEYTGIYKGKNLIFILAEAFNTIAVDENRTPTLYKLIHEGFNFTNYYSPEFLSTTGGEFQAMTGLIPSQEILNLWRNNSPYLPYAIGNAFSKFGYTTSSYHNWLYTYYDRDKTMPTLGFTNYTGCENGLEAKMNCEWLPSDVDLINTSFDNYKEHSPFVTYYITVSGHAPYNFTGGNSIAEKNASTVENLSLSDSVKAYLASQMELEYALNTLIEKLKISGILEDTVIVLTGDHYPYTLTKEEINEISSYERDETIEANHSNLIIWNNQKMNVTIDKVASQIDVLPTILNLFDIPYDARLLVGKDIMSREEGLVIFSNRSWKSDLGTYLNNGKFIPNENAEVTKEYIEKKNKQIANSFTISKMIIEKDLYRKLLGF